MKEFPAADPDPQAIADELLNGGGAVLFRNALPARDVERARQVILEHSESTPDKATHFVGDAERDGTMHLQRRVWNLLAKDDVFIKIATLPLFMSVLRAFLGTRFILGSIAANRILPGGPGQEPHIDYPYWDLYDSESHPVHINSSFPLNAQVTVMLDEFTDASGATAYLPGSQKALTYPSESDQRAFAARARRMVGSPGDAVLFFGAAWHCAMPNRSGADRIGVLLQYLPKWVKPMEDLRSALPPAELETASAELRQLLGLEYPYPQVLEEADYTNSEGRR